MNRFERGVTKLYNAFNESRLNQNQCSACAVGNLLGHRFWSGGSNENNKNDIRTMQVRAAAVNIWRYKENKENKENDSGYTLSELAKIECIFLDCFVGLHREVEHEPQYQYKGLIAVIDYLAELDGIKDYGEHEKAFKEVLTRELKEI
jgi:hypothetical protein